MLSLDKRVAGSSRFSGRSCTIYSGAGPNTAGAATAPKYIKKIHIANTKLNLIKPCTPVLTHCAIMHTGTHTLCNHAHRYSHIVQSCTPVLTNCTIMHTGTHTLCNHATPLHTGILIVLFLHSILNTEFSI